MPILDRDGVALYYEVFGPEDGPPLVLLAGMGGDVPSWRRNLPRLSERLRVVVTDARGNGRSGKPDEPMTMATFVDDTLAVMDALGIERADLYGLSFGGMVALQLALDHPERVRRLVLGSTHAGGASAIRGSPRAPLGKAFRVLYAPGFAEANPEHVAEDLYAGAPTRQPAHARRRQREAVEGFDVADRLPELRAPTLVLHGTGDQLLPAENGRFLAGRIPNARLLVLEGAGHVYQSERPEESDRAVIEFLVEADR